MGFYSCGLDLQEEDSSLMPLLRREDLYASVAVREDLYVRKWLPLPMDVLVVGKIIVLRCFEVCYYR